MTAAALTAVSAEMYPAESARIVAGIVTGIGFLGAGLIVRSATGEVRGQATAAALWTMSGVGIIVGLGNEVLGIILALMAYVILSWDEWPIVARLNRWWAKRHIQNPSQPSNEPGNKI
jgi:putative Mg2+ transporter-C (MgtC) family protein